MYVQDLFVSELLLEMAYTQKKAERVITSLEMPINDNLLKLWTIPDSADRNLWTNNLVNWIAEIAAIVLRPANTRPAHTFYYRLLFFEPFGGGAGIPNVLCRLRRLHRLGFSISTDVTAETALDRLRTFHRDFASSSASGLMREDQIRKLLDDH